MAEHSLLSSIYSAINCLIPPQNRGRGSNAVIDKRVESLSHLSDGKKLAKLLRCEPQDSKPESAKECIANVINGFLSNEFKSKNTLKAFSVEALTQLFAHWNEDFDVLLSFVVLIITIGDELKKYSKKRKQRVVDELETISGYYFSALDNCKNIVNRKPFEPLINLNLDFDFINTLNDSNLEMNTSLESMESTSHSKTDNTDHHMNECQTHENLNFRISYESSEPEVEDEISDHKCELESNTDEVMTSEPLDLSLDRNLIKECFKAIHIPSHSSSVSLTPPITPPTTPPSIPLTPPTTPTITPQTSEKTETTHKRSQNESSDESDSIEKKNTIKLKIKTSFGKVMSTPKKSKRMKCGISCKLIIRSQTKLISSQQILIDSYAIERQNNVKEIQNLINQNERLRHKFETIERENNDLKEQMRMSCDLDDILSNVLTDSFEQQILSETNT